MDKLSAIEFILGCHIIPSEKTGLIALVMADKPVTTAELNSILNCFKTYENYKELYEDHIESGLVRVSVKKDSRGVTRNHFEVDNVVLDSLIENNI